MNSRKSKLYLPALSYDAVRWADITFYNGSPVAHKNDVATSRST